MQLNPPTKVVFWISVVVAVVSFIFNFVGVDILKDIAI
jgi:hypothetical protein